MTCSAMSPNLRPEGSSCLTLGAATVLKVLSGDARLKLL